MPIQPYNEDSTKLSLDNSNLFNAMIYPFTRMVIYGVIWYQGEANTEYHADKYVCTFSKMIQYWRQTWNQRTGNLTDIAFPFGFVQVSFVENIFFCVSITFVAINLYN